MKRIWKYKLYSGALQFTIFISVIVALLLAGIVLLVYTHRYFIQQSKFIIENIELSDSGTIALLQQQEISTDTISLTLPEATEKQSVKMHLSYWGIFEKAHVYVKNHEKEFIKCSLLGTGIKSTDRPALYLQETYKPLVVVGTSKIAGKTYLPQQGIRPGNINGHSYYGSQLIYGATENSTTEMSELSYNYKELLNYYLKEFKPLAATHYLDLMPGTKHIHSFKEGSKGLFSESTIVLENISLSGNIIIRSSEKIVIKATANLRDIILAAPEIVIEDGVQGNFQAIADTSIKVGQNCKLYYPSALILLEKESHPSSPIDLSHNKIVIDKSSIVKGSVCFFKNISTTDTNYKVNVYVSEGSAIKGEVYCEGNLELKGNVTGTVYTNQFIANEGGTIFVNHIYNGTITGGELPEDFGGILFKNESKTVVKWLY